MRLSAAVTLSLGLAAAAGAAPKARNVILFVGDAGGLPTITAAADDGEFDLATATRIALRILFQVMTTAYGWKPQPAR